MKINKLKNLIEETEDNSIEEVDADELIIDPQKDSVEEIADIAQDSVEVASDGEKGLSDADANKVAMEIKQTAAEVGANQAIVSPSENPFVIENAFNRLLDRALISSKKSMRRNDKVNTNVLISGLPGSGKTAIVESWVRDNGLVLVSMNAADSKVDAAVNGMPLRDLTDSQANELVYVYSKEKLGALLDPQNVGKCVLFVDEFNRQTDPQLRRTFLSMFNEKRNADGKLNFSKNLLFTVVCINPACKEDIGAVRLNQAELSRFLYKLYNFDSDPESSLSFFMGSIASKLHKLGIKDIQSVIKNLYGYTLKTKNGVPLVPVSDIEENEYLSDDIDDYIRLLDLAYTIVTDPNFSFDTEDDLSALHSTQRTLLNQRVLTDALYGANGDKQAFLDWVDYSSRLLDRDKEMFHEILNNYYIDMPALRKAYGLDGATSEEDEVNGQSVNDISDKLEDDEDLFGSYNQSIGQEEEVINNPNATKQTILDAMSNW